MKDLTAAHTTDHDTSEAAAAAAATSKPVAFAWSS